jgi:6-pyruvoyltetrahydropterin/6-carboxytetrahydropterin synthase
MTFLSTKTYGPELGLSAVFRQWKANSHCNQLHGYSLGFRFTFEAKELDDRNWVMDFGGLKGLKAKLQQTFDHKLVVANDDPQFQVLLDLQEAGVADVMVVEAVGCEKFAELAALYAQTELELLGLDKRVKVVEVECSEHGANSAIYRP